jgi:hypothetical protein
MQGPSLGKALRNCRGPFFAYEEMLPIPSGEGVRKSSSAIAAYDAIFAS